MWMDSLSLSLSLSNHRLVDNDNDNDPTALPVLAYVHPAITRTKIRAAFHNR